MMHASPAEPLIDREAFPYRMKDLCEKTGLPRQVIHFYIQQGLVPEGQKTGRNMAYYGEEHVARIRLVRKLQHERLLPLKAIRAILDQRDEMFTDAQRNMLAEVKLRLGGALGPMEDDAPEELLLVDELAKELGIESRDVDELVEIGLLGVSEENGHRYIAGTDGWIVSTWAELARAGFTRTLGFSPRDLAIFEQAIDSMFEREAKLLAERIPQMDPAKAASMLERALPLINAFLARYHLTKARQFFAAMG
jgi:DNA-binding transcriptional MerR regulator